MKIISWNCNMAFRKKYQQILTFNPDIAIIQECEHPKKFAKEKSTFTYNDFIWIGDNENKGLGVISFNKFHIKKHHSYTEQIKYALPLICQGNQKINLLAIWAMSHKVKSKSYIGQVWEAVHHYDHLFGNPSLVIGDWNSNAIWDHERNPGNHTNTVNYLKDKHIRSLYHVLNKEAHGMESQPTFYLTKNIAKPYHIDYCFCSRDLVTEETTISVGNPKNWLAFSDHMPLFIDNLEIS